MKQPIYRVRLQRFACGIWSTITLEVAADDIEQAFELAEQGMIGWVACAADYW